jgi:hypothetical protein
VTLLLDRTFFHCRIEARSRHVDSRVLTLVPERQPQVREPGGNARLETRPAYPRHAKGINCLGWRTARGSKTCGKCSECRTQQNCWYNARAALTKLGYPMNIIGVCRHGLGGDLYSTGMDKLAAELNDATPVGCHFTVSGGNDPRLDESSFDQGLLVALSKGATVIYIGHSLGADAALRFCQLAAVNKFNLALVCPVDPVCWDSNAAQFAAGRWEVGPNVARVIGFLSTAFPGQGRVFPAAGNTTTRITDKQLNLPHATLPGGLDIASSPDVHAAIISGVMDVIAELQVS